MLLRRCFVTVFCPFVSFRCAVCCLMCNLDTRLETSQQSEKKQMQYKWYPQPRNLIHRDSISLILRVENIKTHGDETHQFQFQFAFAKSIFFSNSFVVFRFQLKKFLSFFVRFCFVVHKNFNGIGNGVCVCAPDLLKHNSHSEEMRKKCSFTKAFTTTTTIRCALCFYLFFFCWLAAATASAASYNKLLTHTLFFLPFVGIWRRFGYTDAMTLKKCTVKVYTYNTQGKRERKWTVMRRWQSHTTIITPPTTTTIETSDEQTNIPTPSNAVICQKRWFCDCYHAFNLGFLLSKLNATKWFASVKIAMSKFVTPYECLLR